MSEITLLKPVTRYSELDSLRGLAALSVFFGHSISSLAITPYFLQIIGITPLRIFFDAGAAVIFFFLLSGFVLTLPFTKEDNTQIPLFAFYIKRVFRLYPAYIFAISFSLFLKYFFHHDDVLSFSENIKQYWAWNFKDLSLKEVVNTYLLIGPSFNADFIDAVVWSLVVEMKISFLLPFFIIIVKRTNLIFNITFLIVLLYAFNYQYLGIFYIGVILAKYRKRLTEIVGKMHKSQVIILLIISVLLYTARFTLNMIKSQNIMVSYTIPTYIIAIASSIMIITVLSKTRLHTLFRKGLFSFFGNISYSFYLLHWPILLFILSLISNRFSYNFMFIFFSTLGITCLISYGVYKYIEVPFQKLAIIIIKRFPEIGLIKL